MAVASATVAASMILNLAVPVLSAVTGQLCLELTVSYAAHATGVTEPATRASAAEEATIYAVPVQATPLASTATPRTAPALAPTASNGVPTVAVIVFAAAA